MDEQQYRPNGPSWKLWVMIVSGLIALFIVYELLSLIQPYMGWWGPVLADVIGGTVAVSIPGAVIGLGLHFWHNAKLKHLQVRTLKPNANGAYGAIYEGNSTFAQPTNAPLPIGVNVPENYSPSIHNHNDIGQLARLMEMGRTTVSEEKPLALPEPKDIHIPTFAESMNAGLIGPGQGQLMVCYNLERDEETGRLTGQMEPYQQKLEDNSTLFIGGSSRSGKTTFMSHIAAQGAMMNALYYIIDPHLNHPEKSIAVKLDAMKHAFILPPAQSDVEIMQVYQHAEAECLARLHGKETPYSGRLIVFIIDEVLNIFGRAQRTQSKETLALYKNLALFMRDLGTQYNKFGVNGIFASQYVTKDALRLPQANIDWRDGCQSQALLRLPPNQAQAMRLLDNSDLHGVRALPVGHGYMGFVEGGDIIRMASGNVTRNDIHLAAMQVERVPGNGKNYTGYSSGTASVPSSNGFTGRMTRIVEEVPAQPAFEHETHTRDTGALENDVNARIEPLEQGGKAVPWVPGTRPEKQFTYEQEVEFLKFFRSEGSIKRALAEMHLSYGDYQACASRMVQRLNLKGR